MIFFYIEFHNLFDISMSYFLFFFRRQPMTDVDCTGLDQGQVLAALYNNSTDQGMGFIHADMKHIMTKQEADVLLEKEKHFDYLYGRVMHIDFCGYPTLSSYLYDKDVGGGAMQNVVNGLKK